jgi:Na+-translocating ferredoxin:NAD+ oxidoreductase RnfG subunit
VRTRLATLAVAVLALAPPATAKVFLTVEEALRLAFPGAKVERRTAYLTKAQQEQARRLSGNPDLPDALAVYYAASKDGRPAGTAYFDTHVVRTMPETIMVVVDPGGRVVRIEVLSFSEPEEYLPRAHWYEQFQGKPLDDELSLKRGVRAVTGATLTARATTAAARRVLALDAVLRGAETAGKDGPR